MINELKEIFHFNLILCEKENANSLKFDFEQINSRLFIENVLRNCVFDVERIYYHNRKQKLSRLSI